MLYRHGASLSCVHVAPHLSWFEVMTAHTGHAAHHSDLPRPLEQFHCQLTWGRAWIHKRRQGCGVIVAGITVGILAGVTVIRIVILLLLLSVLFLQVVVADLCWDLLLSALSFKILVVVARLCWYVIVFDVVLWCFRCWVDLIAFARYRYA